MKKTIVCGDLMFCTNGKWRGIITITRGDNVSEYFGPEFDTEQEAETKTTKTILELTTDNANHNYPIVINGFEAGKS